MNKKIQDKKRKTRDESESESEIESDDSDKGVIPDSDSDEENYDDSDDGSDFNEITAEFEINPCVESDYHSIKNMISRLVPYNETINFSAGAITNLILEQSKKLKFGRSIRVEGVDDPYGFLSVFNYNSVKDNESIEGLTEFMKIKSKSAETSFVDTKTHGGDSTFLSVLTNLLSKSKAQPLGYVFNERFLNVPNDLVYPLHQYIQYDIELLTENDPTYNFKNYLFLTTFGITTKPNETEQPQPQPTETTNKSKTKKSKHTISEDQPQQQPQQQNDQLPEGLEIYQKVEDKYIKKHSSAWLTFNIPYEYGEGSRWTLNGHLNYKGLIMILPSSKVPNLLKDLQEKAILDD
ncbi:hypothetical protein DLAC_08138 [Tieghemostelium lacteum]|uniref:Protein BCP1 n=1 Tax=Tieghemostelium lacteum TaxID=361077 RepID=A0A151ZB86_TIELA|nr:hypothetical protein DLAC_08138 [Tieghemostelium lacteum]|eukprot:KYQ91212.1 hypothetical protein DLAC_08138 [Tieghemostelium lacteum]